MHPTFRQVPPKVPASTMAIRLPSNSGLTSEFPDPVPTIASSKWVLFTTGEPTGADADGSSGRHPRPPPAAQTAKAGPSGLRGKCRSGREFALAEQHDQSLLRSHAERAEDRG